MVTFIRIKPCHRQYHQSLSYGDRRDKIEIIIKVKRTKTKGLTLTVSLNVVFMSQRPFQDQDGMETARVRSRPCCGRKYVMCRGWDQR
jgi:hypothetical protein